MKTSAKIKGVIISSLFLFAMGANANQTTTSSQIADDGMFAGSVQAIIELDPQPISNLQTLNAEAITNTKIISLIRLNQTQEMIAKAEQAEAAIARGEVKEKDYTDGVKSFKDSKAGKDLAMNDVPVLDQGKHGTCVTFAATAALDAVLSKGDFIDQQCSLAHNLFLGKNYWDGARYPSQIIDPLKEHGVVEKNKCSKKYPVPSLKIKTEDYVKLTHPEVTVKESKSKYFSDVSLDDIRNSINDGKRVSIGFRLKNTSDPISVQGFSVNIGDKKHKGGLWACKQPSSKSNFCGFAFSGHEVVVVGYDDEQKLLKIRNSWGTAAGDEGEFYMTYEFFDAMSIDGTAVW